jgi:hypothetical protein
VAFRLCPQWYTALKACWEAKPAVRKKMGMSFVGAVLGITDAVANKQITDGDKFNSGLSKMIDGVVDCMSASVWSKAK